MISAKPFYFMRHGQTDANLAGVFQGNVDIPLNDTGIRQAQSARDKLAAVPIATIISSPMQRARHTAEIVNERHSIEIVEDAGLKEADFGPYEGQPHEFWLGEYLTGDDTNIPDDVEPIADFLKRTQAAINAALKYPGPVLIVAHGGVYMAINQMLHPHQRRGLSNCEAVFHSPGNVPGEAWSVSTM